MMPALFRSVALALLTACIASQSAAAIQIKRTFSDHSDRDQDDMALWIHPTDPALSTVIGSDKKAGRIYVYDLNGEVLQAVPSPHPGNIDIRYGFSLGGRCVDLVALNERKGRRIRVYQVDPTSRHLERVDDLHIKTGRNYGFTLYRNQEGKLFAFTGPKGRHTTIRQWELMDDGHGRITGRRTKWKFRGSTVEGMVGDDDEGWVFLAEETVGVWRVSAENRHDRKPIAPVAPGGLEAELEGLAIYHGAGKSGYLTVSEQGADRFSVLQRQPPHDRIGIFRIDGVGDTDGIEVSNIPLGPSFASGIFLFHNGVHCCPVQAATWKSIADELGGLPTDTRSWDPRQDHASCSARPASRPSRSSDAEAR